MKLLDNAPKKKDLINLTIKAGGKVFYFDYGLSYVADFGKKKFWLAYVYRAKRDGYEGYKIMTIEQLKEEIKKIRGSWVDKEKTERG